MDLRGGLFQPQGGGDTVPQVVQRAGKAAAVAGAVHQAGQEEHASGEDDHDQQQAQQGCQPGAAAGRLIVVIVLLRLLGIEVTVQARVPRLVTGVGVLLRLLLAVYPWRALLRRVVLRLAGNGLIGLRRRGLAGIDHGNIVLRHPAAHRGHHPGFLGDGGILLQGRGFLHGGGVLGGKLCLVPVRTAMAHIGGGRLLGFVGIKIISHAAYSLQSRD